MIIAISGKIGSGKDTVGGIINWLSSPKIRMGYNDNFKTFMKDGGTFSDSFKTKKFAGVLKDFICLLLGCTREQLEDPEFKNKALGPEWWYFYFPSGSINSYNPKIHYPGFWHSQYLRKHTPRTLLTSIGTDAIKTIVHPNAWINALFANYQQIVGYAPGNYYCKCGKCGEQFMGDKRAVRCEKCSIFYPNWIITDLRFPDEFDAVKQREGITIRVNRPYTTTGGNGIPATFDKSQFHISETALDNHKFDYIIENDGSMEDLIEKVKQILIQEKII